MGKVLDGTFNAELANGHGAIEHGSYWVDNKYTNALYTPNSDSYADFEYGQTYLELSRTERDLVDLVTSNFDDVIVIYNGANTLEMGWVEEYPQIKGVLLCAGAGATGFRSCIQRRNASILALEKSIKCQNIATNHPGKRRKTPVNTCS